MEAGSTATIIIDKLDGLLINEARLLQGALSPEGVEFLRGAEGYSASNRKLRCMG